MQKMETSALWLLPHLANETSGQSFESVDNPLFPFL
jgi:hypothetical protein